jgi:hypothetical protein
VLLIRAILQAFVKLGYAWSEALREVEQESEEPATPVYKVRTWQRGALLFCAGSVMQFFSYAFGPSFLLAMASLQMVTHLVAAYWLEGVPIPRRSIAAAAVVVAANCALVVFGSKHSDILTSLELQALHRYDPLPKCGFMLCMKRMSRLHAYGRHTA